MRILLVDDDERFLGALEALLDTLPNTEVAGRVLDGAAEARVHRPDRRVPLLVPGSKLVEAGGAGALDCARLRSVARPRPRWARATPVARCAPTSGRSTCTRPLATGTPSR